MPHCCVSRRPRVPCHIHIGLCYIVVSQSDDQNDALKEGEKLSKIALTPATHTHPFVFFSAFECVNLKMPCHPVWHLEDTIGNCKSTPECRSKPKKAEHLHVQHVCLFSQFWIAAGLSTQEVGHVCWIMPCFSKNVFLKVGKLKGTIVLSSLEWFTSNP